MRATAKERLDRHLIVMPSGCREWTDGASSEGYGRIYFEGKVIGAHRLAWTLANGSIPAGLDVLHHCDNPPCCQTKPTPGYPEGHLFVGTNADNVADMDTKGRRVNSQSAKTQCPQGHAYSESNTYVGPNGKRRCRQCRSDQWAAKALGRANSDKTHCPQNHPYDAANTLVDSRGRRSCRRCGVLASQHYRSRKV